MLSGMQVRYNRSSHGYEELLVSLEPDIPQQQASALLGKNAWIH